MYNHRQKLLYDFLIPFTQLEWKIKHSYIVCFYIDGIFHWSHQQRFQRRQQMSIYGRFLFRSIFTGCENMCGRSTPTRVCRLQRQRLWGLMRRRELLFVLKIVVYPFGGAILFFIKLYSVPARLYWYQRFAGCAARTQKNSPFSVHQPDSNAGTCRNVFSLPRCVLSDWHCWHAKRWPSNNLPWVANGFHQNVRRRWSASRMGLNRLSAI